MINRVGTALVGFCISAILGAAGTAAAELACGDHVTASLTLDRDLDCTADGLQVSGDRVVVDCAGHTLRGAAVPQTAGIRITGGNAVVVRNCHVVGFAAAIDATEAPDLLVTDNRLEDGRFYGLVARRSPGVRVIRNVCRRQGFHASISDSPGSVIEDNEFEAGVRPGSVNLVRSAESVVARNAFSGGGSIGASDGGAAVVDRNVFRGGPSSIQVIRVQACRVARNVFEAAEAPHSGGGRIALYDGRGCEIRDNRIELAMGAGLFVDGESELSGGNRIAGNTMRGGFVGLYLFGSHGDVIESNRVEDTSYGIVLFSSVDPSGAPITVTTGARVVRNTISGAVYGLFVVDSEGNVFERNDLKDNGAAALDLRMFDREDVVNTYENNRIVSSSNYGFVAWGSSPVLRGNQFRDNGAEPGVSAPDLEPLPTILDHRRGALALIPFVGSGNDTIDDGNPGNDHLGTPAIGDPRRPNIYHGNGDFDVYALDERVANEGSFRGGDRFQWSLPRFRQDWFGIIRVEDASGAPVAGATVEVSDARGRRVATFATGDDGVAPTGIDPARPQGLSPLEPGGPVPPWPRFSESVIDASGQRVAKTPHRVVARKGDASGCAVYAWNGRTDQGESGTTIDGRYQTAVVRIGTPCLP